MTTPGGVPNLPLGALTVETLGQQLQDMSAAAMRQRAGQRFPQIFNASTGGNVLNDLTPFGILTRIWSEINALIAASSPNDINGPEDLPELLTDFIENLPVIGQFVQLLQALLGLYDGDDETLLQIQELFAPIRGLLQAILGQYEGDDPVLQGIETLFIQLRTIVETFLSVTGGNLATLTDNIPIVGDLVDTLLGITGGTGTLDDLGKWAKDLPNIPSLVAALTGAGPEDLPALDLPSLQTWAQNLLTQQTPIPADNLFGQIPVAAIGSIPVAHISPDAPNLLSQGSFNTSGTIAAADGWSWDDTQNRTTGGGGAAKVECNGTLRRLYSSQSIPVSPGDRIEGSAFIKVSGFTGAAGSVNLAIIPFKGSQPQPTVLIGEASSAKLTAAASDWVEIGTNIPGVIGPGVTSIKVRLAVTTAATAGTVWFDSVRVSKAGLLSQDLVSNLTDAWNFIYQGAQGLLNTPTGKTPFDMFEALANPTSIAQTVSSNFALLQDILNTDPGQVLGVNPVNGGPPLGLGAALADGNLTFEEVFTVLGNAAAGTADTIGKALQGDFSGVNNFFNNLLGVFHVSTTAEKNSVTNADNIQETARAVYNGYFGTGGSGQIAEVAETMAEIRTRIQQGYTLQSLTYNGGSRLVSLRASTDASFATVPLLAHCDGSDGSKYLLNSSLSRLAFLPLGNAVISNEQSKFGGGSIKFDGSEKCLAYVNCLATDIAFGSGAFTVEFQLYVSSLDTAPFNLVDFRPAGVNGAYISMCVDSDGSLNFTANSAVRISSAASAVTTGMWHHVAVSRSGTSTRMFLNGVQVGSTYSDSTIYLSGADRPVFGANAYLDGFGGNLNGFMDEIRISGVARYTSNFTAPTTAFPEANNKPTGGTFTLTYGANTTSALAYNATAAQVQSALAGLASIGSGNVVVGGSAGGPYAVTLRSNVASGTLSVTSSLTATSYATADVQNGWVRPWTKTSDAPREFYCIIFGSGQGGAQGNSVRSNSSSDALGGSGGSPGGYAAIELDATEIPETVPYTIAAGGLGGTQSSGRGGTSETSFGDYLKSLAGFQDVTSLLGYFSTPSSSPGAGGSGGAGRTGSTNGTNGAAGATTKLAAGGAGGNGSGDFTTTVTNGLVGTNAPLTGKARSGGGGGGGGGGSCSVYLQSAVFGLPAGYTTKGTGGLGGNGGFPGGGGGGGGGAFTYDLQSVSPSAIAAGNGGNGANGVVILIWK